MEEHKSIVSSKGSNVSLARPLNWVLNCTNHRGQNILDEFTKVKSRTNNKVLLCSTGNYTQYPEILIYDLLLDFKTKKIYMQPFQTVGWYSLFGVYISINLLLSM